MFKEFKEFAMKGNVVEMAIGIIIGAAFGNVVSSLVGDVMMPPIGKLMGNIDFSNLFVSLNGQAYDSLKAAKDAGAPTINYGMFVNSVIDFVIVALVIFLLVKQMNRLKKEAPAAAPTTKECPFCLSQIPLKATRCVGCTSEVKVA